MNEEQTIKNYILDFSLENDNRIAFFEEYYSKYENMCIELLNRLNGIYQFSGIKSLENFLYELSRKEKTIPCMLRLEASKGLFLFEELEEEFNKHDDENDISSKTDMNIQIKDRNEKRKLKAYESLNIVCSSDLYTLPTPCRVDAVLLLMESNGKYDCDRYFREIINDVKIDCDYRYKTILNLEKRNNILNYKLYIKNACLDFLFNNNNMTMYRILSSQYLLQNLRDEIDDEITNRIQNTILSFAQDNELDYDLRADAADLLLNLGSEEYKTLGREIIMLLGRIEGNVKTLYDNKQNVHTKEIEKSVLNILEILSSYPNLKIGNNEVDFNYIYNEIQKMLKDGKIINEDKGKCIKDKENYKTRFYSPINCKNCDVYIGCIVTNIKYKCESCKKNGEECYVSMIDYDVCSKECEIQFNKYEKIKLSLNRIEMDRTLYLNNTLSKILVKLWSYINNNEYKDEMIKRLFEELEEMSGTCSSGFLSRLVNTISGFGNLQLNISFEDQLVSNFIGRLNAYTRKITEFDSPFYNEKLYDVLELMLRNINPNLLDKKPSNVSIKSIIDEHLKINREDKIFFAIEYFSEAVLNEMTINTIKYNDRRHFLLFFRTYLPNLRQELYEEFKDYIDDFTFDLTIRKAISTYEGLQNFL
jgi:predicted house-cleaning noncanonical NTP pyrophosphatase (MazG superfamily)